MATLGITLLVLFLSACDKIVPNFDKTPYIEPRDIRVTQSLPLEGDSLVITLFFRDGDGDLGIDGTDSPFDFDCFASPYKKFEGREIPVVSTIPGLNYNGRIPRLKNDDKAGPIEGTLNYRLQVFYPQQDLELDKDIQRNDTIFFWIRVRDRSGNFSDSVRTGSVVVLTK